MDAWKLIFLELLAQGRTIQAAADEVGYSKSAVEKWLRKLKTEYDCSNTTELLIKLQKNNVI